MSQSPRLGRPFIRSARPSLSHGGAPSLRDDVQALRGLAVSLVVVFHLFPNILPGGFVGVDAFLAISGYLITSHLWREISETGSLRLSEFWARRVRRLMPAALLVLATILGATILVSPGSEWGDTARDVTSAALYIYNFVLTHESTDYFAQGERPSPVQHFWSLCVEEQFYFIWPLLLLLVVKLVSDANRRLGWVRVVAVSVFLTSLVASVTQSHLHPQASYFLLPTRMWEFLVGASIALFDLRWGPSKFTSASRLVGVLGLVGSAVLLTPAIAFPGWIAVMPVVATAVLLVPVQPTRPEPARGPLDPLWPFVRLGDLSYSIYLWHWPLLILFEDLVLRTPTVPEKLALAGLTVALAAATKLLVEDKVRFARLLSAHPARTFALAGISMVVTIGGATTLSARHDELVRSSKQRAEAILRSGAPCLGAQSRSSDRPCRNPALDLVLVPHPSEAPEDAFLDCGQVHGSSAVLSCTIGDEDSDTTLALVGDSHAGHLIPGLDDAAEDAGVKVVTFVKGGCPLTQSPKKGALREGAECSRWKQDVRKQLKSNKAIDALLMIGHAGAIATAANKADADYDLLLREASSNYAREFDRLPKHIQKVFVIRDTPGADSWVLPCLERLDNIKAQLKRGACSIPIEQALPPDPLVLAAQQRPLKASVFDLTPLFCDATSCPAVIGNVVVYRDPTHITATFSKTLAPTLENYLKKMVADLG